jgi:hypothetical protein
MSCWWIGDFEEMLEVFTTSLSSLKTCFFWLIQFENKQVRSIKVINSFKYKSFSFKTENWSFIGWNSFYTTLFILLPIVILLTDSKFLVYRLITAIFLVTSRKYPFPDVLQTIETYKRIFLLFFLFIYISQTFFLLKLNLKRLF